MAKHRYNLVSAVGVIVVILVVAVALQYAAPYLKKSGPTQAEWDKALGTPANKTLFGEVFARNTNSVTIFAQETGVGTTTVGVASTTAIVRDTPLSAEEMKAAYQEYKKREVEAQGKPFQGPDTMKIETLTLGDIGVEDMILVTLTASSTKDHFVAERIEVLPANTTPPAVPLPASAAQPLP